VKKRSEKSNGFSTVHRRIIALIWEKAKVTFYDWRKQAITLIDPARASGLPHGQIRQRSRENRSQNNGMQHEASDARFSSIPLALGNIESAPEQ
jgi:hypothetical protein